MVHRDNITQRTSQILKNGLKIMVTGSKSSCRESYEARLGPEGTKHLPRCCGRATTGPGVIYHVNITLGTSRKKTDFGTFGPLEAKQNRHGGSSWPERSEGRECLLAGAYTCPKLVARAQRGSRALTRRGVFMCSITAYMYSITRRGTGDR